MKIVFDELPLKRLEKFNGGEKEFRAKMLVDERNKILYGTLIPGASIGYHCHDTSSEMIYVLSGSGKMITDEGEERLSVGDCHYCPMGHSHSFINDGEADLIFFAVVPQQ